MKRRFATVCLWSFFGLAAALAQDANGRISGTVTDKSGAVIPNVRITVTSQATRLNWKSITNNAGYYVVTNLLHE